ncbi:MAG: alpha/beta hydrolase [Chloroflexota bacterium]|nr:alpha/beta hydrolase [Chloroflexota bacterium]MDE2910380.1 alpha/beta hydrolase [Chloroflexota bacterium]
MFFSDQIDPEVLHALDTYPAERYIAVGEDPPLARQMTEAINREMRANLPPTDIEITETMIPGPDCDIPLAIYQPPAPAPRGGLLWFHGGGYIVGVERDDARCIEFAEYIGCAVVSVGYRLAPESTYKESIADSFAALNWMVENASELGIDPDRVAIGGGSAGGGLAAGLAHYNRDSKGPNLAFQLLIYPMIDDTHNTPSGHADTCPTIWNRDVSFKAWKMYLGAEYGTDKVSPYAAATRATDLSDLPPALMTVGAMDLFRDENINYAQRLMAAGIPTDLQVYAGMFHGAEMAAPDAAASKQMRLGYLTSLKRAIG